MPKKATVRPDSPEGKTPKAGRAAKRETRTRPGSQPLVEALATILQARTWSEKKLILKQNPLLLSKAAEKELKRFIEMASSKSDADSLRVFEEHLSLLGRCREVGIASAIQEKERGDRGEFPPEFNDLVLRATDAESRYNRTHNPKTLDQAVAAWMKIIDHPALDDASPGWKWIALNDGGADIFERYRVRGDVGDLDRAIQWWEKALPLATPESPLLPDLLDNLGAALVLRYGSGSGVSTLEWAIELFEHALKHPSVWMFHVTMRLSALACFTTQLAAYSSCTPQLARQPCLIGQLMLGKMR